MDNVLLIFAAIVFSCFNNVLNKLFTRLNADDSATALFTALWEIIAAAVFLAMVFVKGGLAFDRNTIIIGVIAGFVASFTTILFLNSLKTGPFSLSIMLLNLCFVFPVLFSWFYIGEKISLKQLFGIFVIVMVVYILCSEKNKEGYGINIKWLLCIITASVLNGVVMCLLKLHQYIMPGKQMNQYLFVFFTVCAITSYIISRFVQASGQAIEYRRFLILGILLAGSVGGFFILSMVLSSRIPAAVLFPVTSGIPLIISAVIGILAFKEKFQLKTAVSFALGLVSIVLFS